jgi:hypothetical protein
MSARVLAWLAWLLGGLSVAMFFAMVVLTVSSLYVGPSARDASVWGVLGEMWGGVPLLAFPVVGALIASKRPENPIGWICLIVGLFWMLFGLEEGIGAYASARFGQVRPSLTIEALNQGIWALPVGLLGIYMILLFPDGKLPSRRWRPLAWFSGALIALICVTFPLSPGPLGEHPEYSNPLGQEWLSPFVDVGVFVVLLLPLCILASALSLIFRYRRSGGEAREQIKWLAFAACFVGAIYLGGLLARILFAPESLQPGVPEPSWVSLIESLSSLIYASIPTAIGFAVLRYRLYDIDIIINRTLVYGSLTVSLALVYLGGVISLQGLFRAVTGQGSQLAIVATTLAIAAFFNPARRRIQAFIDRRFYRRKYDARKTLEAFSAKLRDETDLEALSEELAGVVGETMQPAHVSIWLRPDEAPRRDAPAL